MSKQLTRYALTFIALIALQTLILNNIKLGGFINPYVYILFIMLLPFEIPGWLLLTLGFITGLTMDAFSGTLGMHSSATLFVAFIRPLILSNISTHESTDKKGSPALNMKDIGWFIKYTFFIVIAHHFVLFYLETFSFAHFFTTLLRVMLSSVFTALFILLSQFFLIRNQSN
ncbi:MAG: rod shape-determining protein MreD [Bacteroidales bacterium]|nr:MAG: rod shape-determining protein MreD [Bacteroidales bacterium]